MDLTKIKDPSFIHKLLIEKLSVTGGHLAAFAVVDLAGLV